MDLDPVVTSNTLSYQPPVQRNLPKDLAMSLGGILLGMFLAGFFSNLASNNAMLILVYAILGLIGAALFVWGLLT